MQFRLRTLVIIVPLVVAPAALTVGWACRHAEAVITLLGVVVVSTLALMATSIFVIVTGYLSAAMIVLATDILAAGRRLLEASATQVGRCRLVELMLFRRRRTPRAKRPASSREVRGGPSAGRSRT